MSSGPSDLPERTPEHVGETESLRAPNFASVPATAPRRNRFLGEVWVQPDWSRTLLIRCDTFWIQWVFFETRAIKSSILERNSFKIGDVFVLL